MSSAARTFRPMAFLLATWAVTVCSNAFYIAPAPIVEDMRASLGISYAQAGALISAYLVAILLFQLPAGYVIDRRDPRSLIVVSAVIVLVLSVLMCLFPRYDVLLALRFLSGIPVAFIFVPSAFLVRRAFPQSSGRAIGLFLSGPPAGAAIGNLLGPSIASSLGWPTVYVAFTLPWIGLLPLFAYFARDLPPQAAEPFTTRDYLAAFKSLELWKVGAVFACSYAAYIFYSGWSPTYLERNGVTAVAALGILSAAIPAAGIVSRPIGGYLEEKTFAADKRRIPMIAFGILVATSLAVPFLGLGAAPLLIAGGFLAQFPFSVYYILSAQIMPERFTGSAYALMNTISLVGGAISPGLAGFLLDVTGSFVASFAMIAATAVVGLALILWTRER
jgi:predicted MFS family arabinose efflux permease